MEIGTGRAVCCIKQMGCVFLCMFWFLLLIVCLSHHKWDEDNLVTRVNKYFVRIII